MTITAAKLRVEVGADTKGAEDGLKRVGQGLHQLGSAGQVALGTVLGNAITGAGRQLMGLGEQALSSYGDFERLGASLQQLSAKELLNTGGATSMADALAKSAGKAKDLQSWVQKLAIESPFTQDGVSQAFRMAMAYGFTTDQAKRLTQAMIDFASGTGATDQTMERIALALGQIQAKGKLAGQEVLQLTQAGLNVDQILAQAFGKSTAEIVKMREAGLIPADQAIEAIVQSLEKDFGGAAKRQSGTISGLVSSLEDLKQVGLREFFGGVFREFQPDVQRMVDSLQDPQTVENIRSWGEEFAKTAREIANTGASVVNWFSGLESGTQKTVVALGLLALNAGTAVKVMTGLYTVATGLPAVVGAISTAWNAWNAGLSLTTALGTAIGPMALTLGAIGLAVGAVTAMWIAWNEQIVKTNNEGNKGVQSTFGQFFGDLKQQGADATKTTDEFIAAYKRMNSEIGKAGVESLFDGKKSFKDLSNAWLETGIAEAASLFVNKNQLAKTSVKEFSDALIATGVSGAEYKEKMMQALRETGILAQNTNHAKIEIEGIDAAYESTAEQLGVLTAEEVDHIQQTKRVKDTYFQLNQSQRDLFSGSSQVVEGFGKIGEGADNLSEKLKGLNSDLKEIVNGQFGAENENYQKQQKDILDQIQETKDKLAELGVPEFLSPEAAKQVDGLKKRLADVNTEMYNIAKGAGIDWKTLSGAKDLNNLDLSGDVVQRLQELRGESYSLYGQIKELGGLPYATEDQMKDIEDQRARLQDLEGQLDETAKAHEEAMRKMAFNMLQERAASDGLTQNEVTNLTTIAQAWGLYDQTTADMINAVNQNLGDLDTSDPGQLMAILEGIMALPSDKAINVKTIYTIEGAPPGRGEGATSRAGEDADIAESITSHAKIGVTALDELYVKAESTKAAFRETSAISSFKTEINGISETTLPPLNKSIESSTELITKFFDVWDAIHSKQVTLRVTMEGSEDIPNPGGGGAALCFVAGTPVNTPEGLRPIEAIRPGDPVITLTSSGPVLSRVVRLFNSVRDDLVQVNVSDGQAFTCSPNHRFLTVDQGWVVAEQLGKGQQLVAIDGPIWVVEVIPVTGALHVYNFEVDHPDHTYCVGGVVVHNRKADDTRASGGLTFAGNDYLVGEEGPELYIPRATGLVVDAQQTNQLASMLSSLLAGGSGAARVVQPVVINVYEAGDPRRTARYVASEIGRMQR